MAARAPNPSAAPTMPRGVRVRCAAASDDHGKRVWIRTARIFGAALRRSAPASAAAGCHHPLPWQRRRCATTTKHASRRRNDRATRIHLHFARHCGSVGCCQSSLVCRRSAKKSTRRSEQRRSVRFADHVPRSSPDAQLAIPKARARADWSRFAPALTPSE